MCAQLERIREFQRTYQEINQSEYSEEQKRLGIAAF